MGLKLEIKLDNYPGRSKSLIAYSWIECDGYLIFAKNSHEIGEMNTSKAKLSTVMFLDR